MKHKKQKISKEYIICLLRTKIDGMGKKNFAEKKGLIILLNFVLGDMSKNYYKIYTPAARKALAKFNTEDEEEFEIYKYLHDTI